MKNIRLMVVTLILFIIMMGAFSMSGTAVNKINKTSKIEMKQ
jgi:hypothetical protein